MIAFIHKHNLPAVIAGLFGAMAAGLATPVVLNYVPPVEHSKPAWLCALAMAIFAVLVLLVAAAARDAPLAAMSRAELGVKLTARYGVDVEWRRDDVWVVDGAHRQGRPTDGLTLLIGGSELPRRVPACAAPPGQPRVAGSHPARAGWLPAPHHRKRSAR